MVLIDRLEIANLDSYFYAISFVNDADSAALSFWMAAA